MLTAPRWVVQPCCITRCPALTGPAGGAVPEPLTRSFDVLAIGRVGVDLYPMQTGKSPRGRHDLRQVPRRQRRQRRRRGGPPRPQQRAGQPHRQRPVRPVRDPRPRRARGRPDLRHHRPLAADAGHLLRDLPARPLPALLLPLPPGARPAGDARGDRPGRRAREPPLLGHPHRPVRRAEPHGARHRLGAARPTPHTVIDLDYRPQFWRDESEATRAAGAAIEASTVAIGNLEECRVAVGTDDPEDAARGPARPWRASSPS